MEIPAEHLTKNPIPGSEPATETWWSRYEANLVRGGLTATARAVLKDDSGYIVERGIFGAGMPGGGAWPVGRVRRGLVMGAVQSGKTASMLAVTAMSLDAKIDMVVLLAGTRVSLWRQTYDRLSAQLGPIHSPGSAERSWILLPNAGLMRAQDDEPSPSDYYSIPRAQLRRVRSTGQPIVAVVMKNVYHLRAMVELLRTATEVFEQTASPFHVLILDDEADDGSILDARREATADPGLDDLKQIPRAIVDLWATRPHVGESASKWMFATYVGYTATPQANFLQASYNPLAPADFVAALRTPFDTGERDPRSVSYREPTGPDSFYTGGEVFYGRMKAHLTRCASGDEDADLLRAAREFLVASAIRRWREPDRLSFPKAAEATFTTRDEASAQCPRTQSMLLHPSANVADHFEAAAQLLASLGSMTVDEGRSRVEQGSRSLPISELLASLEGDEVAWREILDSYRQSSLAFGAEFGPAHARPVPSDDEWPKLREILATDVIPGVRFKIINSDPRADDRPQFEPLQTEEGTWVAPPDLATIFISGNVMSRGLTLEGLTTTLFLRRSDNPFADTQMQMQRWFGFRGKYLDLCRVFLPEPQLDLFRQYHDVDTALRQAVLGAMNEAGEKAPRPTVLQGLSFAATGKLASVGTVPLCPGPFPFIADLNVSDASDPNAEVLANTFRDRLSAEVTVNGIPRGRILKDALSLRQAADLLDQLTCERIRTAESGWEVRRWADLDAQISGGGTDSGDGLLPLFRPGTTLPGSGDDATVGGPHAIAAYLRLWEACLTRRVRGLVSTNDPLEPWYLANLGQKGLSQPRFHVGIRYGSGAPVQSGPLASLGFDLPSMKRNYAAGRLTGAWGSRGDAGNLDSYAGDQFFDYHVSGLQAPEQVAGETFWRPEGHPGLILFHVIEREGGGAPLVTVGLALPLGGPDQFAARSAA